MSSLSKTILVAIVLLLSPSCFASPMPQQVMPVQASTNPGTQGSQSNSNNPAVGQLQIDPNKQGTQGGLTQEQLNEIMRIKQELSRNNGGTVNTGTNTGGTTGSNPQGTNPQGTNPQGTNPQGTNPQGTNPQGTNPQGTDPGGSATPGAGNTHFADKPTFEKEILAAVNDWRKRSGAPPMQWDAALADFGYQNGVNQCVYKHTFEENRGIPTIPIERGENLAVGVTTPKATVDAWVADEIPQMNFENPVANTAGHMQTILWKGSNKIGCSRKYCPEQNGWVIYCNTLPRPLSFDAQVTRDNIKRPTGT